MTPALPLLCCKCFKSVGSKVCDGSGLSSVNFTASSYCPAPLPSPLFSVLLSPLSPYHLSWYSFCSLYHMCCYPHCAIQHLSWCSRCFLYRIPCVPSVLLTCSIVPSFLPIICPGIRSVFSVICPGVLPVYHLFCCPLCSLYPLSWCPLCSITGPSIPNLIFVPSVLIITMFFLLPF